MSERMTDEDVAGLRRMLRGALTFLGDGKEEVAAMYLKTLAEETERARASEDQKEAVIKALADALEHAEGAMVTALAGLDATSELKADIARIAALRLAGRL